jgi:hypothetical protein
MEFKRRNKNVALISFCEFRRLRTPMEECKPLDLKVIRLFKTIPKGTKPSSGVAELGKADSRKRRIFQKVLWRFLIKRFIKRHIHAADVVLHFNDVAFPGNYITNWLKKRGVKQAMLQEGIRFPLPNESESKYASCGADMIFCWGEFSLNHFRNVASARSQLLISGSPRYQDIRSKYSGDRNAQRYIGVFTNPIDDQGFCTHIEKVTLFRRLIEKISDNLKERGLVLLLKAHPRENIAEYEDILRISGVSYEIGDNDIFKCISEVAGGIIFASSVGVELLFLGKNLAQLEMPGFGFLFDYVENGVALPVSEETSGAEIVSYILDNEKNYSEYLSKHLESEMKSAEVICEKMIELC